ncbi:hypothetical protein JP0165_08510 [Helicobacter pylori]
MPPERAKDPLTCTWVINGGFFASVDVNLQYYAVSMHTGYKTNNLTSPFDKAFKANTQDRSNLVVSLKFFF